MGAHFAPPFAIITMHKVESLALEKLKKINFQPIMYRRYIDDVILGPVKRSPMIGNILQIFNSVNEDIKFTLESPDVGKPLNFLDISIKIINFGIEYSWFTKPSHSNNSLRQDSWVPQHVKTNCVKNAIANVNQRCSNATLQHKCL